jgi:hypothetical protein
MGAFGVSKFGKVLFGEGEDFALKEQMKGVSNMMIR